MVPPGGKTGTIAIVIAFFMGIYLTTLWYAATAPASSVTVSKHKKERVLPPSYAFCEYFYVDLGSAAGVQLRKLFEPLCYPNDPVLKIFDQHLLRPKKRLQAGFPLCAVGFEAHPKHTERLEAVEHHLASSLGFNVKILTGTAVGHTEREVEIFEKGKESSIVPEIGGRTKTATEVPLINIGQFMLDEIIKPSKIPGGPNILMKMNLDGSEYEALASLALNGVLCSISLIMVSWHPEAGGGAPKDFKKSLEYLLKQVDECKTTFMDMDDAAYGGDKEDGGKECVLPVDAHDR